MRTLIRELQEAINFPTNSVGAKKFKQVRLPELGVIYTEPPDTEDSFPPVIASYEVVDGWLVYHGRNGSIGIVVGTKTKLKKWMADVDKAVGFTPVLETARPWTKEDGGAPLVKAAIKVAHSVAPSAKIDVVVDGGQTRGEASGSTLTLFNVHRTSKVKMLGISLPTHLAIAAHEAAHLQFAHGGREVMKVLEAYRKQGGEYVSLYHSLSGNDFEGVMEAAALYTLKPAYLRKKAPGIYDAIAAWLG